MRRVLLGVVVSCMVVAFMACGGGGGGAVPNAPTAPNPVGTSTPPVGNQSQNTIVTITIPSSTTQASSRRPLFVSPGVNGALIQVFTQGTTTPALVSKTYDLSATSTLCTLVSGGRQCTLAIGLPIGPDTLVITLYDSAPISGVIPTTAKQLGTASQNTTVVAGSPPLLIAVPVLPIVTSVAVTAPTTQFYSLKSEQGPQSVAFALLESDASGNVVSGTLATPIIVKLTETGGSGFASLNLGSTTGASQVILNSSTDAPSVAYTGGGVAGYAFTVTFTLQGSTTPLITEQFSPVFVAPSSPSSLFTAATQTAAMQGWPSSLTLTASAVGASTAAYTSAVASACATVVSVVQSGPNFTLTGGTGSASGCTITISMVGGSGSTVVNVNNAPAGPATGTGSVNLAGASEYPIPVALPAALSGSYGQTAVAADGSLWFTAITAGSLQQFVPGATPSLGTSITVPFSGIGSSLIFGPDGNMWFLSVGDALPRLIEQNLLSTIQSQYLIPNSGSVSSLANGPDGQIWGASPYPSEFVSASVNGIIQSYPQTLTPQYIVAGVPGTNSAGIAGGPGLLWSLDTAGDILNFTPSSPNTVNTAAPACVGAPPSLGVPVGMVIDPSGNLWMVNGASGLREATIATNGTATCVPITDTLAGSTGIVALAAGPDGVIWGLDNGVGLIAVLPGTTTAIHAPQDVLATGAHYGGLVVDTLGNVWFADANTGKIYEYHP